MICFFDLDLNQKQNGTGYTVAALFDNISKNSAQDGFAISTTLCYATLFEKIIFSAKDFLLKVRATFINLFPTFMVITIELCFLRYLQFVSFWNFNRLFSTIMSLCIYIRSH